MTGSNQSMSSDKSISDLAAALKAAEEERHPCPPIRDYIAQGDVDAAYAVQTINTDLELAKGRRPVGRKIGLTSKVVQQQLGVDQPDYGMLYGDMAYGDGETLPISRLLQPKVEGEIALVMAQDLTVEAPTLADLISSVAYALPALEIVDSRIANWDISLVDTIADNASSGLFALGSSPKMLTDISLREVQMTLKQNGEVASQGSGVDCLGGPLNAALWLARKMVEVGRPLKAGDIVMTGALGPMLTVSPGDSFEMSLTGLGTMAISFSAD